MDLLGLELAGVIPAAVVIFGGIHLESLSHLSFFLAAGFADLGEDGFGALGDFTHFDVSVDVNGPDGHCHELVDGAAAVVGVGVVVVIFLGFTTTLFGQDKFGGLLALYFGA